MYKPTLQQRRSFLKSCAKSGAGLAAARGISASGLLGWLASDAGRAEAQDAHVRNWLSLADPMVGTGWRGHMFPGATVPFGLVQLSPDSSGPPEPHWNIQGDWYEWQHCSGYNYHDNVIDGFSHTHVQGTGGLDLADLLIMPMVEGRNWSWQPGKLDASSEMQVEALGTDSGAVFSPSELGYRSFFSHARETAKPGYYSVHLDTPGVEAELTATTRCGMHRYTFPATDGKRGIIADLVHGLHSTPFAAEVTVESMTRIHGGRSTHGWAQKRNVYFVLELSEPAAAIEFSVDGVVTQAKPGEHVAGKDIRVILTRQSGSDPLIVRVGISPVSQEGAAANLRGEIGNRGFDEITHQAAEIWNRELAKVDATLLNASDEKAFYSAAYHSLIAPATFCDVDGSYRGQDLKIHPSPGFTKYTTLSIWDIYRGEFPYLMLVQPDRINDIIRTMILDYQQLGQHALPMWPLWANETWSMTGFHAAAMILGAYVRGFRDWDVDAAYQAVRDTALVGADAHGNGELQKMFRDHGYVPCDLHGGSVSQTLDLSYDYWCAGAFAKLLGKQEDSDLFLKLSQGYRNVFNPTTGFMQGRTAAGTWREGFEPDRETDDYVESDAWQASFSVPHDVHGLIELYGGDARFLDKLEGLFTAPSRVVDARPDITGMVGQDAQGNEPSNHHPYLFSFAGAPWKTQYWVRKVAGLYNATPAGIPGNDDCGQLSSWFVFASLGFYPVNAATGVYVIGSPLVKRAAIRNPKTGTSFSVIAENNSSENLYIQSASLNGKDLRRSWITHRQIAAGGELRLRMGSRPDKDWASDPGDRPPSDLLES